MRGPRGNEEGRKNILLYVRRNFIITVDINVIIINTMSQSVSYNTMTTLTFKQKGTEKIRKIESNSS